MSRHVVDTNVLIVASGEHSDSPFASANHPVEDPAEAEKVLEWLADFAESSNRMIIDSSWAIPGEYDNKLTDQDYGRLVFTEKLSKSQVDFVEVEWGEDPSIPDTDRVAKLEEPLKSIIHDLADTKMVAACISANNSEMPCTIVNACDTDWYDCQEPLEAAGIAVEQVIEDWSRKKWKEHHDR